MKAITLWQPWATLIAIGAKPFETRSWRPSENLIGQRIAIHAGLHELSPSKDVTQAAFQEIARAIARAGLSLEEVLDLRGVVVCTAVILSAERVDKAHEFARMAPDRFGDYSVGRWVWRLGQVEPVTPFECRGAQTWFSVPDELVAAHAPQVTA